MAMLTKKPQTMVDVYRLLPEGTPVQVINNQFYRSPAPEFNHFSVQRSIFRTMDKYVEENSLGTVVFTPVDVYLGDRNAVQPDVFFLSKEHESYIQRDGVYGSPDIVIEVLSPKNKNADLIKKKPVYEQYGIQEYFIVEPFDKSVITYYLQDKKYVEQKKQSERIISKVLNKTFFF